MKCTDRVILVTGAGGFIGSHLVEALVRRGNRVKGFVRYTSQANVGFLDLLPAEIRKEISITHGDLRDSDAVRGAAHGCDLIFHLGALIAIPYSYLHPREVVETNLIGTLNVLMAARDLGASRVIHTSTSEVYGTAQSNSINEDHPIHGQSPYAASKIAADKLAESFYRSFNLPVSIVRPFNTYGPRQSDRAVIPTIIAQALMEGEIRLGNLRSIRDFTYVDDTVQGFIGMAEADEGIGEEVNLGTGREYSIGELARRILHLMRKEALPIREDRTRVRPAESEVWRLKADFSKAMKLLNWSPKVELDEGLTRTIEWVSRHADLYHPDAYRL